LVWWSAGGVDDLHAVFSNLIAGGLRLCPRFGDLFSKLAAKPGSDPFRPDCDLDVSASDYTGGVIETIGGW